MGVTESPRKEAGRRVSTIDKTKGKGRGRREHHRQRSSCQLSEDARSSSADTSVGYRK
jgi:hypothetical protein